MKSWMALALGILALPNCEQGWTADVAGEARVYVLPVRDNIMPPMVYLVRRGVKEAMAAKADVLVLDMKTDGGRVDVTIDIVKILNQFQGQTVTYVNDRAFSAGAFISAATQKIYMAPQSVIGAAAPIMMLPGGGGAQEMPNTFEVKMNSAIRALVRTSAEKNGHNVEVFEAMIDKNKELIIDDKVINKKGDILTLTNIQAEQQHGDPPRPLLSSGTVEDITGLLTEIGYGRAQLTEIRPTGVEKLAMWINAISPVLLIVGILGIYIEFKTPGFGLPGIVGLLAFALYFFGGYVAGLSGMEWIVVFALGLALVAIELFFFPGTVIVGLAGSGLMLIALVMAMIDVYPGMPSLPTLPQLRVRFQELFLTLLAATVLIWLLSRWLPRTSLYSTLVSQSASGVQSVAAQEEQHASRLGATGTTVSVLRPGGKAQFGETILDVMSQGEMIEKGRRVRIVGHSGGDAIVEAVS
jgi:membrane-bound serine protease (ClpP class)